MAKGKGVEGLAKFIKILFLLLNVVFLILGAGLIGLGAYAMTQLRFGNLTKLIEVPWPIGTIAVGGFVLLLSLFGCCGALKESRLLLGLYFTFLFLIVGVQVFVVVYSYKYDSNGTLDNALSNGWSKADTNLKNWTQNYFICCGFQNVTDGPVAPCPPDATAGCKEKIKQYIEDNVKAVQIAGIIIASIQFVGLLFSLCLCCSVPSSDDKKRENYWDYSTKYARIA